MSELTLQAWQMIQAIAPAMHASRFFGVNSPEQAMAIMISGYELGLGFAASFEFIKPIQGKPSLTPRGALALILASPLCAGLKIEDLVDKGQLQLCRVWMKRTDGFEHTIEFSMDDAKRAGLVRFDSGWEKYPANMLRWRAVGFCADVVFPDVIGGLKRADELGADLTPDGEVIEDSWMVHAPEIREAITLDQLVTQYGAEAILGANNGSIPATTEDLERVAEVLSNGITAS